MLYYRIDNPADVRDLGEQVAEWTASGNPKAALWAPQPARPSEAHDWISGEWVLMPVSDAMRMERNARLAACDWTQLADAPVDRAAWATYRQALRDLPETYSGSGPIPWPVAP